MKYIYNFCGILINYIGSPLFWVTTLGPILQGINMVWLRNKLNIPYEGRVNANPLESSNGLEGLKIILDNHWAYALNDFNVQQFVVLLTIILMLFTLFAKFVYISIDEGNFEFKSAKLQKNKHNLLIFASTLVISIVGVVCLMNGFFASPESIKLYLPRNGIMNGSFRIPPLSSPLTIYRIILILLGIYIAYWNRLLSQKSTTN